MGSRDFSGVVPRSQGHLLASPRVIRGGQHLETAILLVFVLLRELTEASAP
ncbi:hypothetical protein D3C74_14390 [compost metagenome]